MPKENIIIVGDIHGKWGEINFLINKKSPRIVLQCGDFGFFPKFHNTRGIDSEEFEMYEHTKIRKPWNQYGIKNPNTVVYFAPGNHEDWNSLDELEVNKNFELMPNVFYQPFGSTITLPDGRTVLFCGGARSIDRDWRTSGVDWFEQEEISYRDMDRLPNIAVDIVISHTCPEEIMLQMSTKGIYYDQTNPLHKDSSRQALSYIMEKYKPDLWYFGHFHREIKGMWKNTRWYALSMPEGHGRWWRYLK